MMTRRRRKRGKLMMKLIYLYRNYCQYHSFSNFYHVQTTHRFCLSGLTVVFFGLSILTVGAYYAVIGRMLCAQRTHSRGTLYASHWVPSTFLKKSSNLLDMREKIILLWFWLHFWHIIDIYTFIQFEQTSFTGKMATLIVHRFLPFWVTQ